jgi:RNA-directed DNA polymerase
VKQQLLDGTYRPGPVRRKTIEKEDGGERLLGIPNVLDRLIQQAILQILTQTFDPEFSESSFGFRPNRGCHGAVKQAQQIIRQGFNQIVDVDLSKFFDTVQHDVLMSRVSRKVHDKRLLKLIDGYLRAGIMVEGVVQPTEAGAPQGGPLSPMLSNILLDDLDKELERRGLKFVRYADDFQVFVKSSRSAERVFGSVQRYLERTLKLVVNQRKSCVRVADGWIRRRLRMCYWKQWRYARTKVAKLRELGVNLDLAIKHAVSRKSYWRMSRTPAMRYAMPNIWLAEQGLLSLAQLWYE